MTDFMPDYSNTNLETDLSKIELTLTEIGVDISTIMTKFSPMHPDFTEETADFLFDISRNTLDFMKKVAGKIEQLEK